MSKELDWSLLEKLNYDWDYIEQAFELFRSREGEKRKPCISELYNYLKMVYKGNKVLDKRLFGEDLHFLNTVSWKNVLKKPKKCEAGVKRLDVHLEDCVFYGKERPLASSAVKVWKDTFEE